MNIPVVANLLGMNPLMTPEQVGTLRDLLQSEEQVLSRLNAEIQESSLLLEKLARRRDTLYHSLTGRSPTQTDNLKADVLRREHELEHLDADRRALQNYLAHLRRESPLDPGHISRTERLIATHGDRIADAQAALDAQRNTLSPIRRIPVEVLTEIFRWCLDAENDYHKVIPFNGQLLLTAVCSSWRKLALGIPSLWASISIRISLKKCHPSPDLIQLWIQRSSLHPLSFSIQEELQLEEFKFANSASEISCRTILQLFVPAYDRWASVGIKLRDWRMATGLEMLPKDAVLSSLSVLRLHKDFWVEAEDRQLRQILSSPKLRDFTWYTRRAPMQPLDVIHTKQLARICITRPVTLEEYFDILTRCPVLESADIFVQLTGQDVDNSSAALIHLPHLTMLYLTVDTTIAPLLHHIVAPSLVSLRITRLDEFFLVDQASTISFWNQAEIFALWSRSKCKLKTLDLRDAEMTGRDVLHVLGLCSDSLENLHLTNERSKTCCVNDEVLKALTPSRDGTGEYLCPRLGTLKLWRCVASTDGLLSDMIIRRRDPSVVDKVLRIILVLLPTEHAQPLDGYRLKHMHSLRSGITLLS